MKNIKRYLIQNKRIICLLLLTVLLSFGIYIVRVGDFVLGYDFQYQHLFFYAEFKRLLFSGQLPFWSRNLFLGANFYASKAYYLVGDPFAYIAILFPLEKLTYGICFTYMLKYMCAGLSFYQLPSSVVVL